MAALPARHMRPESDTDAPPLSGQALAQASRDPGLRILVAEDNPVHRAYLLQTLIDLGHRPEAAVNGMEAVKLLSSIDFDLAFLDLRMPVLNGEEVLRSIRDGFIARVDPALPVVAVTAQCERGLRVRMSAAGFDAFIGKPLRRSDVFQTLKTLVDQDRHDTPAVDLPAARSWLCNDDGTVFKRILNIFLEQATGFLNLASAALAAGDTDTLRFGSHSLANSAGMLQAERLRLACLALEKTTRVDDIEAARQALAPVKQELAPVTAAVRSYLERC
ncbi:response regulator [Desulfocurvibacter africanus]|uniref:response regulator n=1 Tax=Desulfocurvibacter africanus TaxID=873 RepID=UPI002FDA4434